MNELCEKCGGACCQYLMFQSFGMPPEFDELMLTRGDRIGEKIMIPARCKHLLDGGKCGIYESRPTACRIFPVGGPECLIAQKFHHRT